MTQQQLINKIDELEQQLLSATKELQDIKTCIAKQETANVSVESSAIPFMPFISEPLGFTLDDLYAAFGKSKKKGRLKAALRGNNITTLEQFLSLTPGEVLALKKVGYETLLSTKKAIEKLGLVW